MAASSYFDASNPTGPEQDNEVRLLFVEHSPEYAALVCETLDRSAHAHFEVSHADRLDVAERDLAVGDYDALLLDLTGSDNSDGRSLTIDAASAIASRLPVILLTGSDEERLALGQADEASAMREGIAHSPLPDAILIPYSAVLRSGQRELVFVDLGEGRFEPREVELGIRGEGDVVQVTEGLDEGEAVVVQAQFMLDSESQVQEAIGKFLERGTGEELP